MVDKIKILGVGISDLNLEAAVNEVLGMVGRGQQGYICVVPVATLVDCQQDPRYRQVVNHAQMATPDGMPVVWLCHWHKARQVSRVYGPQLMKSVCDKGQEKGLSHFFYGSNPETLDKLMQRLTDKFPRIKIAGSYAPPYTPQPQVESSDVLAKINQAKPDIIWVALGSPKQDFWMSMNRPLLDAPLMVGVGAAFDFLAGVKPQAPKWMQRCGLEWFFRLCCEPGRLWKRYLIGNSLFVFYLLRSFFKK